jgi:hypothetical protein
MGAKQNCSQIKAVQKPVFAKGPAVAEKDLKTVQVRLG